MTLPLELVNTIAQLGVIPLIVVLWRLNTTIEELKVSMHRDFVRKDEAHLFLRGE